MTRSAYAWLRTGTVLAFFVIAFAGLVRSSLAQIPKVNIYKDTPKYQETRLPMDEMKVGSRKVLDPNPKVLEENRRIMAEIAKWNAYRLNEAPFNGELEESLSAPKEKEGPLTEDKPITKLFTETQRWLVVPSGTKALSKDQMDYVNEYGKAMAKELVFVLKNAPKPIVRINAARMLAQTAQMPCVALVDPFLEIIQDEKELEAVKLYAFDGIRELLNHNDPLEPKKSIIREAEPQTKIAKALIDYIMKPRPEIVQDPEQVRVHQFIRMRAVRALGSLRETVIRDKGGRIVFVPATTLLQIGMNDPRIVPEPGIAEQLEAVIGFCQMRIDRDLDVGAAVRGVHYGLLNVIRKQAPDRNYPGREKSIPWKISGNRLRQAMETWKQHADELLVAQNPKLIVDYTKAMIDAALARYESEGIAARVDAPILNDWRTKLESNNKQLVKDRPETVLDPPADAPPMKK